jgi:ferric-dicitrate binding protein FerR (iron transport regulator)
MYDTSEIARLIKKKLEGTITAGELLLLKSWAEQDSLNADLLEKIDNEEMVLGDVLRWVELKDSEDEGDWVKRLEDSTFDKIANKSQNRSGNTIIFRKLMMYAAVSLIISVFAFIIYRSNVLDNDHIAIEDLTPGTNKALITLSDGRVIELSEEQEGVILGEEMTYGDGTLITQLDEQKVVHATIETPRGGQYQITLIDGTKVWLNADTKLTYPSRFKGEARIVELEGEAYFDVSPLIVQGNKIPFLVKTAQQEIEVLGTQFNVSAYPDDDDDTQTTLVEGAVRVYSGQTILLLKPGEQGISNAKGLNKKAVDVGQYIAWKNNEFVFEETELKEALKMLSRWYDFDINLNNIFPKTHLYGSISREKNLTEVLKIMESSGLKFKIERSGDRNRLTVLY